MRIFNLEIRNPFASKNPQSVQADQLTPPEAVWSERGVYGNKDFPKYNPDDLLSRKGYGIYQRMMTDEQVKAVVRFKRDAITSRDAVFDCAYDALSEDERKKRIALFYEILRQMENSFSDALNGIMAAMYMGFSLSEKVLKPISHEGKTWVGIKKLKLRPCDTFFFHVDEFGNIIKTTQRLNTREKEQEIDMGRMIHFVQNPDYDEHYGRSELREAYRPWFSKDMVIKFQNIHLERFAAGFMWASPKDGKTIAANSTEYESLKRVMQNLQGTSSIILPSGIDLNIEHPSTTDAFERAVAQHDKSIAKSLLVPNLLGITEQGQHGSLAQAGTQLEAFLWTLDADATRLEAALNQQLFKELGDLNWGDGMYPTFKFKPISDAQKLEIIKTWKDLVTAGSVQNTEVDEKYLRDALEFPEKPFVQDKVPNLVLNGAQVGTLVEIISKVGKGELSPEAAKAIIVAVFPIDAEQAASMVDTAKVEPPKTDPSAQPTIDPKTGLPIPPVTDPTAKPAANQDPKASAAQIDPKIDPKTGQPYLNETVVGKQNISISAFSKAMKRVDFAVIANKADNTVQDTVHAIATLNSAVVARLVAQAEELKLGTADGNPKDITKLLYTAAEMSQLKAAVTDGLQASWDIGVTHAKREIAKADAKQKFAVNDLALQDMAGTYLKAKGYSLAGDISNATKKIINNILVEGVKVSKTASETKQAIYKALESEGMISEEAVMDALGAVTVKDAAARISTAIRTTSFEAINEARYDFFSDPALDGFVEALEYSAILDDRTCFAAGTLIQSTKGMIPIESIKPDDEVISGSGKVRRVRARKTAISKDWREITFEDGTMVRATPTHPLWTLQRGGYRWMEVKALKIGDRVGGKDLSTLRETIHHTAIKAGEVLQPSMLFQGKTGIMADTELQVLQSGIQCTKDLCGSRSKPRDILLGEMQGKEPTWRTIEEGHNMHVRKMCANLYGSPIGTKEQPQTLLEKVPEHGNNQAVPNMREGIHSERIFGSDVLFGSMLSKVEAGNTTGNNGAGNSGEFESDISAGSKTGQKFDRLRGGESNSDRSGRHILAFEPASKGCGCTQGHQDLEDGFATYQIAGDGSVRIQEAGILADVDHSIKPQADLSYAIVAIRDIQDDPAFCYDVEIEGDHCYLLANGVIAHNTEICSQLNGETYGIDSEVWSTFRPPNHFNCRSILVPVTIRDTWTASEDPTVNPQKGFGF